MSLTPVHRGDWSYYQREVTHDLEAYFEGRGEEPGRWLGAGAAAAGLSGPVEEGQLGRLFDEGCHPISGEALGVCYSGQAATRTVSGYGLTFSPPKSVSVLWGLGNQHVHAEVRAAHDAAVAESIRFLEDHAAFSRRGKGGVFQIDTEGYLAAAFTHRTSRADDPQLHTHVLVAAKCHGSDGRWRSLDGRELFGFKKAAGTVYQAALRTELSGRLGVVWQPVDRNGQADLVGVPRELLGHFSQRRRQVSAAGAARIAAWENQLGRSLIDAERAVQYQLAAYETRPAKSHGAADEGTLAGRWRAEATAIGHSAETWMDDAVGRRPARAPLWDNASLVAEVIAELEERYSTWGRAEVAAAVARRLPVDLAGGALAARAAAERGCAAVLAARQVLRLAAPGEGPVPEGLRRRDGDATFERHGARRYSTRATVATEARVLDAVERGRQAGSGLALPERVEVAGTELGADQGSALRRLCLGGEGVICLVGPAGTGKTHTLAAAVQAWADSGVPVRGLAVSAAAAEVLAEETGVATDTVAKLLYQHDMGDPAWALRRGEVVLVDEAGMLATRDLAALCQLVEEVGGKLVLTGDPRQLGPVRAGGLFPPLAVDPSLTVELHQTRRFAEAWEADATLRLRHQDPAVLARYAERGRISAGDREAMIEVALDSWQAARAEGRSVLVIADDHATVDALAARARGLRVAAGEVEARGMAVGGHTVGVGDEIVTCRNDRRLVTSTARWVRNGDRWVVTARRRDGGLAVASLAGKGRALLPAGYVAEHVALAYAVTAHKAQGVTVDRALVIVEPSTCAEQLYVGMTRGRQVNQALVICEPDPDSRRPGLQPMDVLTGVLARSGLEASATQYLREQLDASEDLALLWPMYLQAKALIDRGAGPDRRVELDRHRPAAEAYQQAGLDATEARQEVGELREELAQARTSLGRIRAGWAQAQQARHSRLPWRRPEPGTLARLDQQFGRLAERIRDLEPQLWRAQSDLERAERDQTNLADGHGRYQEIAHQAAREAWRDEHPLEVTRRNNLVRRIDERTAELGQRAVRTQPDHLIQLIGPAPADPRRCERWQDLAAHLEAYRERWRIHPDQIAHHVPSPGAQAHTWEQLTRSITERRRAERAPERTRAAYGPSRYPYEHDRHRDRSGSGLGR